MRFLISVFVIILFKYLLGIGHKLVAHTKEVYLNIIKDLRVTILQPLSKTETFPSKYLPWSSFSLQ